MRPVVQICPALLPHGGHALHLPAACWLATWCCPHSTSAHTDALPEAVLTGPSVCVLGQLVILTGPSPRFVDVAGPRPEREPPQGFQNRVGKVPHPARLSRGQDQGKHVEREGIRLGRPPAPAAARAAARHSIKKLSSSQPTTPAGALTTRVAT